jgi:hypothetical protein
MEAGVYFMAELKAKSKRVTYGLCTFILAQPTALANLDKASIVDDESDVQGKTCDSVTMQNSGVPRYRVDQGSKDELSFKPLHVKKPQISSGTITFIQVCGQERVDMIWN